MSSTSNKLSRTTIHGNYVGRDHVEHKILPPPTQMSLLEEKYKEELKSGNITSSIIDELTHYNSQRHEVRDLATKLSEANLSELIEDAEELKQLISMLIMKHQNYKSAQQIITIVLDDVASIFNAKIRPHINNDTTRKIVDQLLAEHLERAVQETLGDNVLEIYRRQIRGMVFFLTGNCHLEWS
jgi:uncharacterized membrane protein YheB (UPF0754 family)